MRVTLSILAAAVVCASTSFDSSTVDLVEARADYSVTREWRGKPRKHYTIGYPLQDCVRASDKACIDAVVARHGVEDAAMAASEGINLAVKNNNVAMVRYLFDMFDQVYRTKGLFCCPYIVETAASHATTEVLKTVLGYYENYPGFIGAPLMYALRYSVLANRIDNASYVIETFNANDGFAVAVASTMSWAIHKEKCVAGLSVVLDYIEPRLDQFEKALEWTFNEGMNNSTLTKMTYILDRLHAHPVQLQKHVCNALTRQHWASTTTVIEHLAKRYSPEYLARGWRALLINAARRGNKQVTDLVTMNFLAPHPELGGAAVAMARKSALRHKHNEIAASLEPFDKTTGLNK